MPPNDTTPLRRFKASRQRSKLAGGLLGRQEHIHPGREATARQGAPEEAGSTSSSPLPPPPPTRLVSPDQKLPPSPPRPARVRVAGWVEAQVQGRESDMDHCRRAEHSGHPGQLGGGGGGGGVIRASCATGVCMALTTYRTAYTHANSTTGDDCELYSNPTSNQAVEAHKHAGHTHRSHTVRPLPTTPPCAPLPPPKEP